jgi:hypothetical protein
MGKIEYPAGKPCLCGCGQPARRNIGPDGRNRGWHKYAEGHRPPPVLCDPVVRARAHKAHTAAWLERYPAGTRRIKQVYGKQYWEIKVPGQRRWLLEHRWIMEQRLGRKLLRTEHVHHRDDDGLNNGRHADGKDNLLLLTNSEHMKLTHKGVPREMCHCRCPHCGASLTHFKRLHKRSFKERGKAADKAFYARPKARRRRLPAAD